MKKDRRPPSIDEGLLKKLRCLGPECPSNAKLVFDHSAADSFGRTSSSRSSDASNRSIKRLVSEDILSIELEKCDPQYVSGCEEDGEHLSLGAQIHDGSPMRCVSELDSIASDSSVRDKDQIDENISELSGHLPDESKMLYFPNPLWNSKFLIIHTQALRLEAELHPLRMILSRLMLHPTYNRKGIFNSPVDPVALGIPDYYLIIKRPMDLGSVKAKLHVIAYKSKQEVALDIRLVFENAMKYNPPINAVHLAAKELFHIFNTSYIALDPEGSMLSHDGVSSVGSSAALLGGNICGVVAAGESSSYTGKSAASPLDTLKLSPQTRDEPSRLKKATRAIALSLSCSTSPLTGFMKKQLGGASYSSPHCCNSCRGQTCSVCEHGCLPLEPLPLICNGANCAGAKIRKGAVFYTAKDGCRHYCQRCYSGLTTLVPNTGTDNALRYKCDLLKRKNEEEIVESWLDCTKCTDRVHQTCGMYNVYVQSADSFICFKCRLIPMEESPRTVSFEMNYNENAEMFTFMSGSCLPVPMGSSKDSQLRAGEEVLNAASLPETNVSAFIQRKVRDIIMESDCAENTEKTVLIRTISDCDRHFKVPDVVRKHFRVATKSSVPSGKAVPPPEEVAYNSKAIALFQKLDGLDVCVFCMYVHEYNGNVKYESTLHRKNTSSRKRVYVAYLDSVEYFRPRHIRTRVYHEILVSYLATARARGYETAHIWACPPSRGNSFVFWNHPASQRTPTTERLVSWYHEALSRAIECGVVTDVKSLYESDFEEYQQISNTENDAIQNSRVIGKMICPPLFDGDFWIEEAVRIYNTTIARHLKSKSSSTEGFSSATSSNFYEQRWDPCPAVQLSLLLRERVMVHPSSVPFRRPVNAAAMKLKDYHKIVAKPMDLGTVFSKCLLGDYCNLTELVADVKLVFSNAMRFNPSGHYVHNMAIELGAFFFSELNALTCLWYESASNPSSAHFWDFFGDISLNLEVRLISFARNNAMDDVSTSQAVLVSETSSVGSPTPEVVKTEVENMKADSSRSGLSDDAISLCGVRNNEKKAGELFSERCHKNSRGNPMDLELTTGGTEVVSRRMIGRDTWLMDKKPPCAPKRASSSKKAVVKRRRNSTDTIQETSTKRRRQSWLCEEVGASIRRMRTTFFTCSLDRKEIMSQEEQEKLIQFESYTKQFMLQSSSETGYSLSSVADVRDALLEFLQFRNLEFSTLRHAKYSTSILLYHLFNHDAPGLIPVCTSCKQNIRGVRWHKAKKRSSLSKGSLSKKLSEIKWRSEDLCAPCYSKHSRGEDFNPLQVSFR